MARVRLARWSSKSWLGQTTEHKFSRLKDFLGSRLLPDCIRTSSSADIFSFFLFHPNLFGVLFVVPFCFCFCVCVRSTCALHARPLLPSSSSGGDERLALVPHALLYPHSHILFRPISLYLLYIPPRLISSLFYLFSPFFLIDIRLLRMLLVYG